MFLSKGKEQRGTDIICFKTINKFNAQENKIENKEVNSYNNVLKMMLMLILYRIQIANSISKNEEAQ